MKRTVFRLGVVIVAIVKAATPVQAQERSPIADLLDQARVALTTELAYRRADSLAREVLLLGSRVPRFYRVQALQIVAAAQFPEVGGRQDTAQARIAIKEMVKLDLDARLPRELSWRGLDLLAEDVARSTYSISAIMRSDNPIVGITGEGRIRVRANRPSRFVLRGRSRDGFESVFLDSVAASTDTVLRIPVYRGDRMILQSGVYDVALTGTDVATQETIVRRLEVVASVPKYEEVPIPVSIDSSQLVPERRGPQRIEGIMTGLLAATAAVALGSATHNESPLRTLSSSNKARASAFMIGLGVSVAAWFDRGELLEQNRAANLRLLRSFERSLRAAVQENEKRAREYFASLSITEDNR